MTIDVHSYSAMVLKWWQLLLLMIQTHPLQINELSPFNLDFFKQYKVFIWSVDMYTCKICNIKEYEIFS